MAVIANKVTPVGCAEVMMTFQYVKKAAGTVPGCRVSEIKRQLQQTGEPVLGTSVLKRVKADSMRPGKGCYYEAHFCKLPPSLLTELLVLE